jgi:hypothetical protein
MHKNTLNDPITDQEIAFAHLLLAGTMNDRRAAEAVGLNPEAAAVTSSKPRVRAYMVEHRASVEQKLFDQQVEGLCQLNLGRGQILTRLWALASFSPEATKGSIAGQIKALAMIVAIEGLIPDRRRAPVGNQPAAPLPAQPGISHYPQTEIPRHPAPKRANDPPSCDRSGPINPFVHPETKTSFADAAGIVFDAVIGTPNSLKLPISPMKGISAYFR